MASISSPSAQSAARLHLSSAYDGARVRRCADGAFSVALLPAGAAAEANAAVIAGDASCALLPSGGILDARFHPLRPRTLIALREDALLVYAVELAASGSIGVGLVATLEFDHRAGAQLAAAPSAFAFGRGGAESALYLLCADGSVYCAAPLLPGADGGAVARPLPADLEASGDSDGESFGGSRAGEEDGGGMAAFAPRLVPLLVRGPEYRRRSGACDIVALPCAALPAQALAIAFSDGCVVALAGFCGPPRADDAQDGADEGAGASAGTRGGGAPRLRVRVAGASEATWLVVDACALEAASVPRLIVADGAADALHLGGAAGAVLAVSERSATLIECTWADDVTILAAVLDVGEVAAEGGPSLVAFRRMGVVDVEVAAVEGVCVAGNEAAIKGTESAIVGAEIALCDGVWSVVVWRRPKGVAGASSGPRDVCVRWLLSPLSLIARTNGGSEFGAGATPRDASALSLAFDAVAPLPSTYCPPPANECEFDARPAAALSCALAEAQFQLADRVAAAARAPLLLSITEATLQPGGDGVSTPAERLIANEARTLAAETTELERRAAAAVSEHVALRRDFERAAMAMRRQARAAAPLADLEGLADLAERLERLEAALPA